MDPFERKKRMAQGVKTHATNMEEMAKFGATKLMSRSEANAQTAAAGVAFNGAGSYMEASRKVYFEEHQREQGSLFRQKLTEAQQVNGHEAAQQAGSLRSFAPR